MRREIADKQWLRDARVLRASDNTYYRRRRSLLVTRASIADCGVQ